MEKLIRSKGHRECYWHHHKIVTSLWCRVSNTRLCDILDAADAIRYDHGVQWERARQAYTIGYASLASLAMTEIRFRKSEHYSRKYSCYSSYRARHARSYYCSFAKHHSPVNKNIRFCCHFLCVSCFMRRGQEYLELSIASCVPCF